MSINISIEQLSHQDLHALSKDLIVTAISKRNEKYSKSARVEAFKVDVQKKIINIPLAYSINLLHSRPTSREASSPSEGSKTPNGSSQDEPWNKTDFSFKGNLLKRQEDILEESMNILNTKRTILLSLYTGFGKTIYALYLVSQLGYKTLILCHRKIIIEQWCDSIKRYLPDVKYRVLDPKITDYSNFDIVIANVINIPKLNESRYVSFGTIVIDEIHTVCTEKFSISLKSINPKYAIGLSATPERSDGMDRIIDLYVGGGKIIRKMWRIFNVYKLETGIKPDYTTTADGTMNWNSVLQSLAQNSKRNTLICNIIRYFKCRTILVLVKLIDHAKVLQEELAQMGIEASTFMNTDKFVNYTSPVLIATYSKGGVGFDHPGLDMLILGADVEENFLQYLGRVFRKDDTFPIVVDLVDNLSSCKSHSTSRNSVYKEVGGHIQKFEKTFWRFYKHFYSPRQVGSGL